MGVRTLLRSWAIPLARVPMLSMRWERNNWASNFLRAVMSLLMDRDGFPLLLCQVVAH